MLNGSRVLDYVSVCINLSFFALGYSELNEGDPDDAFEGSNAYQFVIPNQETENFSFDPEVGILQEPDDERRYYEDVVKPKRDEDDRQQGKMIMAFKVEQ